MMFLIVPAPSEAGVLVGQLGQAPGAVVLCLPPFPLVGDSGCSPPRLQCLCRPQVGGQRGRRPWTDEVPRASTIRDGVSSMSSRRRAAPTARSASSAAAAGSGGGGYGAALPRAAAGCAADLAPRRSRGGLTERRSGRVCENKSVLMLPSARPAL